MRFCETRRIRAITVLTAIGGSFVVGACAPAFNWRELALPETEGLIALFPCKPERMQQRIQWPGLPQAQVHLWTCLSGGFRWSLAMTRADDAKWVPSVLENWSAGLVQQSAYRVEAMPPLNVKGATPQPAARAWKATLTAGHLTGANRPVTVWTWHFSHGLHAFQASVWGLSPEELPANSEDVVTVFRNGFYFQK